MAYLVMARKWRPRTFAEMVGQDHIATTIRHAIEGGRIAHAYLFTGTRGVGKTTAARILAKCLNCQKGPTADPCGECRGCQSVSAGNSMDVLEIDGASNNSVENIRDLREQVKYAPMQGKYKVYIIDEVHMLSRNAFNALLKTLEEPPAHVVFIFATTEIGRVPHTILSRVQRFDFKRISEAQIRERLEFICAREGIDAEAGALEMIARKADGSMRDGLSLFDQVHAYAGARLAARDVEKVLGIPPESLFEDLLSGVTGHNAAACFRVLEAAYNQGIEFGELLAGFGEYLRDLLFARQPGMTAAALGIGERRMEKLVAAPGDLADGDILRYAKIVSDMLHALKSSAHPRLTVELGFARLASLDRVVVLSRLLASGNGAAGAREGGASRGNAPTAEPASSPAAWANDKGEGHSPDDQGAGQKSPAAAPEDGRQEAGPKKKIPDVSLNPGAPRAHEPLKGASPGAGPHREEVSPAPPSLEPAHDSGMPAWNGTGREEAAGPPASLRGRPEAPSSPVATALATLPRRRPPAGAKEYPIPGSGAGQDSESAFGARAGPEDGRDHAGTGTDPDDTDAADMEMDDTGGADRDVEATRAVDADVEATRAVDADADATGAVDTDPEGKGGAGTGSPGPHLEPPPDFEAPIGDSRETFAPPDPEEAMPPRAQEEDRPPEVPPQTSLEALARQWHRLVAEFRARHPVLGGHLQWTSLFVVREDTPELRLNFAHGHAYSLVNGDLELKKSLHRFLGGKLERPEPFALVLEPAEADTARPTPPAGTQDDSQDWEEVLEKEPIIRLIRDLFEGRMLSR